MIQGGGFTKDYSRKSTRAPVSNEAYNGLRNEKYTLAMARTTAPHSATSQFFINSVNNRNLDHTSTDQRGWGYTVFGRVLEGEDVVDAISQVRTGPGGDFGRDVPLEPIVILSIKQRAAQGGNDTSDNAEPVKAIPDSENDDDTEIEEASPGSTTNSALKNTQTELSKTSTNAATGQVKTGDTLVSPN